MKRALPRFALVFALAGGCAAGHHRASRPSEEVSIAPSTAEVWAWRAEIGGTLPAPVLACRVWRGDAQLVDARTVSGRWSAQVPLAAGMNEVRAECVDSERRVYRSAISRLRGMLRDVPTARVVASAGDRAIVLDASTSTPSGGSRAPIASYAWSVEPSGVARIEGDGPRARVTLEAGAPSAVVRVEVRDQRGASDAARARVGPGPRFRDAVVYGVVPPLFGTPPLRAVRGALGDLANLGVDVLWLSPVFEAPPGDYGYAVVDYLRVRSDYGSDADLASLVEEAHARGLRVVLDLAANHTSDQHRYFRDARALGRASHYFGFYHRDATGEPTHYFDWQNLPNLEYENPEVARWMLEATLHWMREAHVDGYRLDAAWGIERRTPRFWDAFREETRRIDPDALLVAEASARDPFWLEHRYDAGYDWTDEPGHWAWERAFDEPDEIADRLDAAVRTQTTHVLRFLENNDTGPRFLTRHGPDLTRVAAAALLTLPGTPSLFTGQERGAEYEPYAQSEPLPPGDPHDLRPWYRALIALRASNAALRADGYVRARIDPVDPRTLAYVRHDETASSVALVVLRFDGRASRAKILLPAFAPPERTWRDALGGSAAFRSRGGAIEIDLRPWSAHVLVRTASTSGDR